MKRAAAYAALLMLAVFVLSAAASLAGVPAWLERVPQLALAFGGAATAAAAFSTGDPPRRGWLLLVGATGLALCIGPILAGGVRLAGLPLAPCLIIVANLLMASASLVLLAVLRASGLAPPWSGGWKLGAVAGLLGSLALGASVVMTMDVAPGVDGAAWSARRIVGVAADIIVFNAALGMLRITLPMQRGLVAVPYFLLAAAAGLFMAVGLGLALANALAQTELGLVGRIVDTAAWCCIGLAGLAQAQTLRAAADPLDDPAD
ncbi:MAG: hypothetical protein AAF721_23000 [Myxococcota bacterium]